MKAREKVIDKIKVGGLYYKIVELDFIEINGDRNFKGACRYRNLEIELLKEIPEELKNQTLVHEILHAIIEEVGIDLEEEEDFVNRISKVLYQVLKENDLSFMRK